VLVQQKNSNFTKFEFQEKTNLTVPKPKDPMKGSEVGQFEQGEEKTGVKKWEGKGEGRG